MSASPEFGSRGVTAPHRDFTDRCRLFASAAGALRCSRPVFSSRGKVQHHVGEALSLDDHMVAQPSCGQFFVTLTNGLQDAGMFGERLAKAIARSQLNATIGAEPLVKRESLFG